MRRTTSGSACRNTTISLFNHTVSRSLVATCDVYLQAPQKLVSEHLAKLADKKGIVMDGLDTLAVLSGARFQRLVGYRNLFSQKAEELVDTGKVTYMVNL